jgi:hypothetical protein
MESEWDRLVASRRCESHRLVRSRQERRHIGGRDRRGRSVACDESNGQNFVCKTDYAVSAYRRWSHTDIEHIISIIIHLVTLHYVIVCGRIRGAGGLPWWSLSRIVICCGRYALEQHRELLMTVSNGMVTSSVDTSIEIQLTNCSKCDTMLYSACGINGSWLAPPMVDGPFKSPGLFARVRQILKRAMLTVPSSLGLGWNVLPSSICQFTFHFPDWLYL